MPKYLLRRRNRFGRYVHLDTYDWEPTDYDIEKKFGPGEYTILIAEEGKRGLQKLRDISIQWKVDIVDFKNGRWTAEEIDEIAKIHGPGNFFELIGCRIHIWQRYSTPEQPKLTWEFLQDGAPVMKNVSVLFRVEMPWI